MNTGLLRFITSEAVANRVKNNTDVVAEYDIKMRFVHSTAATPCCPNCLMDDHNQATVVVVFRDLLGADRTETACSYCAMAALVESYNVDPSYTVLIEVTQ